MSTTQTSNIFITQTLAEYTPRAATYDSAQGGWHADLGRDFVSWLPAPKGGTVLDLACGTGLVSLSYAEAVGPDGTVVGIDITEAMLDEAKRKTVPKDSGNVVWIKADITDLSSLSAVQEVVNSRGGFDIMSCCSALVLLEHPQRAINHWATLLQPNTGKLIIDIPTEDRTLMYLMNHPLRRALGKATTFDVEWIADIHSLEKRFTDAGLEVEKSFRTKSYLPEKWYDADQALEVLDYKVAQSGLWKEVMRQYESEAGEGGKERVGKVWEEIWKESLNEEGKLWDGHKLYVTIGRRRE